MTIPSAIITKINGSQGMFILRVPISDRSQRIATTKRIHENVGKRFLRLNMFRLSNLGS